MPPVEVVDPFLTYNFRVQWEGRYVAAATRVSGLSRRTQVVSFHAGDTPRTPRKLPGQTDYTPITVSRGITTDGAFATWLDRMTATPEREHDPPESNEMALDSFRKPMAIEVYDQAGMLALRYLIHNCWPSEYAALPELDSQADAVAFASFTIEHEGWERDSSVPGPPAGAAG